MELKFFREDFLILAEDFLLQDLMQIGAIAIFAELIGQSFHLDGIDPALTKSDFLRAGDFQPLAFFHGLDILGSIQQGIVGAGTDAFSHASRPCAS
jgi:hypothetical protein